MNDPREAEKDHNDPLARATTFEDLMSVVGPYGRWTITVVFLCAIGTYARTHDDTLCSFVCLLQEC